MCETTIGAVITAVIAFTWKARDGSTMMVPATAFSNLAYLFRLANFQTILPNKTYNRIMINKPYKKTIVSQSSQSS